MALSIAAAVVEFGVGWHTAHHAAIDYTDPVIDGPCSSRRCPWIGVDEKRFFNATVQHRTDLHHSDRRLGPPLPVRCDRGPHPLTFSPLARRTCVHWCAQITLATFDPAAGYRLALVLNLPKRSSSSITSTRSASPTPRSTIFGDTCQQERLVHRGRKGDPLIGPGACSSPSYEHLSDERFAWMFEMLDAGDPDGIVGAAILAKELFRDVYTAVDVAHARRRLIVFFQHCADADVTELNRLAQTIDRWRPEVLAYHTSGGASNGRVENIHMLAEKIRRNAHGFTNHINYRRRLIGRLGIKWTTVPTRRIRGRQPHSVA